MNKKDKLKLIGNICRSTKHLNPVRDILRVIESPTEMPCPDCYGGHFRPCQMCGDSGFVNIIQEVQTG